MLALAAVLIAADDEDKYTVLINQGWASGQGFLSLTKTQQAAMAAGIVSGLFMSPMMGAPERGREIVALSECTLGMTSVQLAAVLEKYLRDHPEIWNQAVAISAVLSFQSVCPSFDAARKGPSPIRTPLREKQLQSAPDRRAAKP